MDQLQPSQIARRERRRASMISTLLVFGALFALGGFARLVVSLIQEPQQIDFAAYYVAGRLLNAGMPLYHFDAFDPNALGVAAIKYTDYVYPPFFAGLLRPLALLPYAQAELVWLTLNLLLYVGNCVLLARLVRMRGRRILLLLCFGLLLPAVYATVLIGQVSLLINLLLLGMLVALLRFEQPALGESVAGILFGLAVAIKIYPAVFGLFLLAERRYRTLGVAAATIAATVGVGIGVGGGWGNTVDWFVAMLPSISNRSAFPANQSLRGVLERLFSATQFRLPVADSDAGVVISLSPVLANPALGSSLSLLLTVMLISVTAWYVFRSRRTVDEAGVLQRASLVLTLMLLITPVAWDLYYVHLLLPLVFLLYHVRNNRKLLSPLLLACLLIALQSYWRYTIRLVPNPLLTLSGFLGVLTLWIVLLRYHPPSEISA